MCVLTFEIFVGYVTYFGYIVFLPYVTNVWKKIQFTSSEIEVVASKSSKARPLPKQRSVPSSNYPITLRYFQILRRLLNISRNETS